MDISPRYTAIKLTEGQPGDLILQKEGKEARLGLVVRHAEKISLLKLEHDYRLISDVSNLVVQEAFKFCSEWRFKLSPALPQGISNNPIGVRPGKVVFCSEGAFIVARLVDAYDLMPEVLVDLNTFSNHELEPNKAYPSCYSGWEIQYRESTDDSWKTIFRSEDG